MVSYSDTVCFAAIAAHIELAAVHAITIAGLAQRIANARDC